MHIAFCGEGFERPVRFLAKPGDFLVGVGLFEGYRVCIDFLDGCNLTAEFLTQESVTAAFGGIVIKIGGFCSSGF